jgi:transposase-like protein
MAKSTAGSERGQEKSRRASPDLMRVLREGLKAQLRVGVMEFIEELFEEERRELIGEPWSRKTDGQARSGGSEEGSIYLEGQRIPVTYPRISGGKGSQATPAYRALRTYDLMAEEVQAKLVRGVSTRDFQDVAGKIAEGTGLGKSTVSRAFVRASARSLAQINGRDLSKEPFVAVFIDGIGFGDALVVAALGVTLGGEKRVLGLVEGHTENATVVASLLDNLVDRGLVLTEKFLAVIDGGKALRAALVRRWQGRVVIGRCQVHKKRNVLEHLPPSYQADIGRRMSVAYGMKDYDEALKFLQKTVEHLRLINEDAARSLEEGMEETLTVVKLALPGPLRRAFSTTNPIESMFDGVRYRTGRVKRWKNGKGQMVMRWTGAAALEIEKRFHKVKGHKLLHLLASALKGNQVDMVEKVG